MPDNNLKFDNKEIEELALYFIESGLNFFKNVDIDEISLEDTSKLLEDLTGVKHIIPSIKDVNKSSKLILLVDELEMRYNRKIQL